MWQGTLRTFNTPIVKNKHTTIPDDHTSKKGQVLEIVVTKFVLDINKHRWH